MGWFSKKRLITSSQVLHMIEDTPDILPQSVMNSLLTDEEIVPNILDTINGCIANKVNIYHEYGKKYYTNGLPEGDIGYQAVSPDIVRHALDTDRPAGTIKINVITSVGITADVSLEKVSLDWLHFNKGMDYTSLSWSVENIKFTYYASSLESESKLKITCFYEIYSSGTGTTKIYRDILVDLPYPIKPGEEYYVVSFEIYSKETQSKVDEGFWYYWINSIKYPDMEPPKPVKDSFYFPVVPIRINNQDYFADSRKDTELFKTSIKLLKKINLDALQIAEGINASPDIDKVDHAYFVLGVNPKSNKAGVNNYLVKFFKDIAAKSIVTKEVFLKWLYETNTLGYSVNNPPINTITIYDATYHVALAWNYVNISFKKGVIGKKGTITKVIDAGYGTRSVTQGSGFNITSIQIEDPRNKIVLKHQLTDDYYEEIEVSGLMFSNRIYGPDKDYISTLASNEGEEIIIPLNLSIMNTVPKLEANTLFYDSILIVINAFEYKKLKWYQTGFFKIVTAILAVAISIFTGGLGTLVSGLITAAAAGVTALALFVGEMVLTSLAASYVFKFAAEHLNIEIVAIFAAIASVYGILGGKGLFNLPFADTMLKIGSFATDALSNKFKEEFTALQIEGAEFAKEAQESMDALANVQKELTPNFYLDPIGAYTQVGMMPRETASEFINRTIGLPNPGVVSLDAVTNFVDNSLRLA